MKTPEEMENAAILDISLIVHNDGEWNAAKKAWFAGYKAAQQWISVKERLPEIDQWCSWWDISGATEPCTAFRSVNDIETWWENYTHWMPLPAAPKEDNK
jgi:hypothetical protein